MRLRYFKTVVDGAITQVCVSELEERVHADVEISEEEYDEIIASIQPEQPEEEATEEDYQDALEKMGVDFHEEE